MDTPCTCGHLLDDHPPVSEPGACQIPDCECEGFELDATKALGQVAALRFRAQAVTGTASGPFEPPETRPAATGASVGTLVSSRPPGSIRFARKVLRATDAY